MINYIWFAMIFFGIIFALFTGNADKITEAIVGGSNNTVNFVIELTGIMCYESCRKEWSYKNIS